MQWSRRNARYARPHGLPTLKSGVRMGMHAGLAILGGDDYVASTCIERRGSLRRPTAGSSILSDATRGLVEGQVDGGVHLLALGEHELRDFTRPEPLFQVVADGLDTAFPPLKTEGRTSHGNLPSRLTTFIGRETELQGLARLLDSNRLITLLGPGGTGKTSLSVELLRREARRFDDGAWFVALESVNDPEPFPPSSPQRSGSCQAVARRSSPACAPSSHRAPLA